MNTLQITARQIAATIPYNAELSFHASGSAVYIQYMGNEADSYCHLAYRCDSPFLATRMAFLLNLIVDGVEHYQH